MSYSNLKFFFTVIISSLLLTSCSSLNVQTLNDKAKELMNKGNIDGAIGRLESINDLNPNYPQTHYNLGIAYYKKGDYEKAVNSLNQAIKLDNKLADAYYVLGVIYEDSALTEVQKAKDGNALEKAEALETIITYFKNAKDSYAQYITLNKATKETEDIKSRIENIDTDINRYEAMLKSKSAAAKN